MASIGDRIRSMRLSKGLTQEEVGRHIGTTKQTLYKYETGIITNIPIDKIDAIAKLFDVSPAYLMGWDEEDPTSSERTIAIPVVGSIPAGVPIEAIEDIVGRVVIPEEWERHGDEYFALRVHGDSMFPICLDGDTVIIKRQSCADSGDICACYVNGYDATLKRVKISAHSITLQPENTNYPPATYTHPGEVTIAGKVVEIRRSV